jgi:hypothetical protein
VKGICKNSLTPSNDAMIPNLRIMGIEEEKRCKQKGFVIYSIK